MSELQKAFVNRLRPQRFTAMRELASRLPGAAIAKEAFQDLEQIALSELKQRLDAVSPQKPQAPDASVSALAQRVHPRMLLSALLDEAAEQDQDMAKRGLFTSILLELTADEACLLAALSDQTDFALINITVGSGIGGQAVVASNFSSIERSAPVKLRDYVPAYLDHLLGLGLCEIGPEIKELEVKYQILEGHPKVQTIVKQLKPAHRTVKFQRRSLRISQLGQDLWGYCDPATNDNA